MLHKYTSIFLFQKKIQEAQVVLEKTRNMTSVETTLKILRSTIDREQKVGFKVKRNALVMSILVASFFQICPKIVGISFILTQTPTIFQIGGVDSKSTASLVSVFISALLLTGSVVNMVLVDRTSRKKLMISALGVLFFGFTVLGFFFYNHQVVSPTTVHSQSCREYSNCYKCLEQQCGYCSNAENKVCKISISSIYCSFLFKVQLKYRNETFFFFFFSCSSKLVHVWESCSLAGMKTGSFLMLAAPITRASSQLGCL